MQHFNKHKKPVSGPTYSNSVIQLENPLLQAKKITSIFKLSIFKVYKNRRV